MILTKEEVLSLKDNSKEYSDNNNQTGMEGFYCCFERSFL